MTRLAVSLGQPAPCSRPDRQLARGGETGNAGKVGGHSRESSIRIEQALLAIPAIVGAQSTFAIRTILSRGPLPLDHWRARP